MTGGQINYDRETDEWRCLVGRALLSFGDIEFFTLRCLANIPADTISKTSLALRFEQRVDLLVEIIEGHHAAPGSAANHLANKLKAAKALATVRNVIAHNPLQLKVYAQPTGDEIVDRVISAARSPDKLIDLAGLKEYAAAVEDLVSELYLALGPAVEQIKDRSPGNRG
jgi:hypothetical protein